jgi:hypothetical protein
MKDEKGLWREFGMNLASGGLSGAVSKTVVAPVERCARVCSDPFSYTACAALYRVKLLLQLQYVSEQLKESDRYKGVVDCVRRVYREQVRSMIVALVSIQTCCTVCSFVRCTGWMWGRAC